MPDPSANPIAQRLSELGDQWTEFAQEPQARLLIWQAQPDELPLLEAFFAQETDAEAAVAPDLFLRLSAPFENPRAHGYALREELIAQYAAAKPELLAEQVEAGWVCPEALPDDNDLTALIRALLSFHSHHQQDIELLAIWLDPSAAQGVPGYLEWLQRLIHASEPRLRFWLVDTADELSALARVEPTHVMAIPCELDMPEALTELAEEAGEETPGGKFRSLLVQLGAASGRGDLAQAELLAAAASALALAQGWLHLAAAAQFCLAGGYLSQQQHLAALRCYTEADRLGEQMQQAAADKGDGAAAGTAVYAQHIRLQARLGQGATLIGHEAWAQAAQVYLAAVALAEASDDKRSQLDCLRLAAFCFDRAGEPDKGWACGMRGFALGGALDDETRKISSLPYLSDHLLRLTERPEYSAHREPIAQQTVRMLGPDWRNSLEVV